MLSPPITMNTSRYKLNLHRVHMINGMLNCCYLFCNLVCYLNIIGLFHSHYQLNKIQRVSAKVIDK